MFFYLHLTNKVVKYIIMTTILVKRKEDLLRLVNNLSSLRKEKGMNQTELGEKVGVSRQTISLIERGDYNPSVMVALSLARVFKVKVEDIFILEEDYE